MKKLLLIALLIVGCGNNSIESEEFCGFKIEIENDGFMYYGEDLRIYHKITNIGDSLLYGFNLEYNGTAYLFTTIDTSIMVDGILIIG